MGHPVGAKHASCQEEILPNQNVSVKNRVSGSAWSKFTGSSDHNGAVSNDLQDWQPICDLIRGRRRRMLYYALVFLVIAFVAAIFGFGGIAATSASIAKILFFLFLVMFLVSLVMHLGRRV